MRRILLLVFTIVSTTLFAQEKVDLSYYLPQGVTYNSEIPTPKSIIGHEVGEWHITHDKLVQYMQALAEVSDRITIENRGKTFEDRPLLLLKITSPKNHTNLESIKQAHINATTSDNANSDRPIVVYQGFSIHG
ncbi:MAG: zinc carboxypeptidase, partial [Winogradskyella sp.]